MTFEDAMEYLNYAEKNGCSVPDTSFMSSGEVIKMAEEMQNKADAAYEAYRERDL